MSAPKKKAELPIGERYLLAFYDAAAYFGIGINSLRALCKDPACDFAITTGARKTMIIRPKLESYINEHRFL